VYEVSGAFHRRGRFLGVDRLDASGAAANPDPTVTNPLEVGRRHLFGMTDYTDGGSRVFPAGLLLRAGEALAWTCWLENGVLFPMRLGCEETPGVVPGSRAGGPATPCPATAPISPECGAGDGGVRPRTGACVPAAVVAGVAPGDETCALQVAYWEVSAGAGCDLGGPPANP
jgi:hypothetical protein